MAHNQERIPWDVFRSKKAIFRVQRLDPVTGKVKVQDAPFGQEDLRTVITAIKAALYEDIVAEGARYTLAEETPPEDEIVISDQAARKITPMVQLWRADVFRQHENDLKLAPADRGPRQMHYDPIQTRAADIDFSSIPGAQKREPEEWTLVASLCAHDATTPCRCVLPRGERRAVAFLRKHPGNDCYQFLEECSREYYGSLVMQSLIIAGEMQPFHQVGCQGSNIFVWERISECYCAGPTMGWGLLQESCLRSYIYLNAMLALSDPDQHRPVMAPKEHQKRGAYKTFTEKGSMSDWFERLHTEFHGARDPDQLSVWARVPLESLALSDEAEEAAREALSRHNLPPELTDLVLRHAAGPAPIHVPGEPLHPDNRVAVTQYLKLCWDIVVRCGVLQNWEPRRKTRAHEGRWNSDIEEIVECLKDNLKNDVLWK